MAIVYVLGGAIVLVAVVFLLLRLRRKPTEKKSYSIDELSLSQKNKKRKHFGFSKSKNKKNNADADEMVNLELLEKKGKKKGKGKAKAAGKKKVAQKVVENHPETESDKDSVEAEEEDKEQDREESEDEELAERFTKEPFEKPLSASKAQVTAAVNIQPNLGITLSEKVDNIELEKSESKKKAKKNKPRKEDEDEAKRQTLAEAEKIERKIVLEAGDSKSKVDENWKNSNTNSHSLPAVVESGEPESVASTGSKNAKKKKKKNKTNASVDVPPATDDVIQAEEGLQNVSVVSAEVTAEKLNDLGEEDVEDGFVQVTRELPVTKSSDAIMLAKDVAKRPSESDSEKALKTALDAELVKSRVLQEQCDKERHENEYLKQALEQMGLRVQEKESKRANLEHSLQQQSHDLKTLNAQLKENAAVTLKMKDENQALKEALAKAQQHAVDEAQKAELQQRVRVMDDALKQNALQLNSIDNARKDLEVREKRQLERIMILERELQASNSELSECRQNAEQRCQAMSSDLQRLTHELAQAEKMRTRYIDLEKQKTELDRHLQSLETRNNDLMNYSRTKDTELQQLQAEIIEISRMNETFQRRSRELESRVSDRDSLALQADSFRQQVCQKDAELKVLHQKEAEMQLKETEIIELQAELHRLRQQLAVFAEEKMELVQKEAELDELQKQVAELPILEAELHELRQKVIAVTQKEAEFLKKEAEFSQKEMEFLQQEAVLVQRLQELELQDTNRSKVGELEEQLSSCRSEIQRLGASEADLAKEVDRLKQELSMVQDQNENFDLMKSELSRQMNQLQWDNEAKETKIAQLGQENQELKDRASELQTSLNERDQNAENFAQVQADLNQRLENALLMQQELDKQKKENTVLRDEIEQMKSELLQHLADNDAQLRQELEEKDREIERLKSQSVAAELTCGSHDKTFNEIVHTQDNNAQQQDIQQSQSDAQIAPEVDRQ